MIWGLVDGDYSNNYHLMMTYFLDFFPIASSYAFCFCIWVIRYLFCCLVTKSRQTLSYPRDCNMPGFSVLHYHPRVHSSSCPLSWWCHLTISSSVTLFSSCPQSLLASRSFPWVISLHQMSKVLVLWLQYQSFQWILSVDFLYDWLVWSFCCPRDPQSLLQHHNLKESILGHSPFFMVQL